MVAVAAWMGGKFDLPLFDRYMQVGVVIVTWRLAIYPGAFWAFDAALWEFALAFLGTIALFIAAYFLKRKEAITGVTVMLESAIWPLAGAFLTILLIRYYEELEVGFEFVEVSLVGLIWLISSANQLYRLRGGAELRRTRIVLASIYGLIGSAFLAVALFVVNPLFDRSALVSGPYVVDSLAAAYLLSALLLAVVALRFGHLPLLLRKRLGAVSALLGALYVGAEIRRWWQGDNLAGHGVLDGELLQLYRCNDAGCGCGCAAGAGVYASVLAATPLGAGGCRAGGGEGVSDRYVRAGRTAARGLVPGVRFGADRDGVGQPDFAKERGEGRGCDPRYLA